MRILMIPVIALLLFPMASPTFSIATETEAITWNDMSKDEYVSLLANDEIPDEERYYLYIENETINKDPDAGANTLMIEIFGDGTILYCIGRVYWGDETRTSIDMGLNCYKYYDPTYANEILEHLAGTELFVDFTVKDYTGFSIHNKSF
jgi:hypothetical protein